MRQLKITQKVTNRDSPALEKYLSDISPIPLINADKEVELALRIQKGDKQALDELSRANLRFVVSVAKQYQGQGLSLIDLIAEGNLGLIKAAGRFDHTKGFKFISYAVWWIRQHILSAIAQQGRTVRLPLNKLATANKMRHATSDLMQKHERAPTIYELADHIGCSIGEVGLLLLNDGRARSLDAPVGSDDTSSPLIELMSDSDSPTTDQQLEHDDLREEVARVLKTLSPREAEVMRLLYGIGEQRAYTLHEVADMIGVTRERTRQIKESAVRRLRQQSRRKVLKQYL